MAEISLEARPILGGADITIGKNRILERDDLAIVSVATPQGSEAAPTMGAIASSLDVAWPDHRHSTVSGEVRAMRATPDQILLLFPHSTPDAEPFVKDRIGDSGYTTDQTDAWVVLEIAGPQTPAALERICPLDLAEEHFPDGAQIE